MPNKHTLKDQLHHETQQKSYDRMKARGYKPNDIERAGGVSMCRIKDKWLEKVRIERSGIIKQYKATIATEREKQMFS